MKQSSNNTTNRSTSSSNNNNKSEATGDLNVSNFGKYQEAYLTS